MNIFPVVEILALAVLLFIAAELYVIARELSRGLTVLLKDRETREGQGAGQTINVNLAPVQAGAAQTGASPSAPGAALAATVADSRQDAPPQADNLRIDSNRAVQDETPAPKSVPSGQFAVKCSRCQAENSSYRHECFNCGGAL